MCTKGGGSQNHLFVRKQNDFFGIKVTLFQQIT